MGETFLSVAIIGALLGGLAGIGTAAVQVIKALFGKNSNKELEYQHQEKLIELVGKQNDNSERLLTSIDGLRTEVTGIRQDLSGLNLRVVELEKKMGNLNS